MNIRHTTHLLGQTVSPIRKVLSRLIEMWIIYQHCLVLHHLWALKLHSTSLQQPQALLHSAADVFFI